MIRTFLSISTIIILSAISSCKKNAACDHEVTSSSSVTCVDSVTDVDGNVYHVVKIGSQCWMQENLKTTHFANNTPITEVEDSATWEAIDSNMYQYGTLTPAWCYPVGNPANNATYGKLYNWFAVNDANHLCPTGWHVPSDDEWHTLATSLDQCSATILSLNGNTTLPESEYAGGVMKANNLWDMPNVGATNTSGFTALPAGFRPWEGNVLNTGVVAHFWSSTATYYHSENAYSRQVLYDSAGIYRNYYEPQAEGCSIRCVAN